MQTTAWVWMGQSEPASLQLTQKQLPNPQPDEVLVANKAVALNPVDWKILRGATPGHIPGVDAAGVVVAAGANANVSVGARVAFHHDLTKDGTFATHTIVAAKALLGIPEGVRFVSAAAVPCPGLTAWQSIAKFPQAPGRDVLVTGGGSATGTYLIQLAIKRGYRVWTTASPRQHNKLLKTGVAGVFDYHDATWQDALLKALDGRRLYAAIDNIGEQNARSLAPLVGYNGHLVCIAGRLNAPPLPAFSTVISLHEIALGAIYQHGSEPNWVSLRQAGAELLGDIATGAMRTPEIAAFSFEQLPEALAALRSGTQQGKLVAELKQG